jgi:MutL C terminal dimerisation domain
VQIASSVIIAIHAGNVLAVDQHAADERVHLEALQARLRAFLARTDDAVNPDQPCTRIASSQTQVEVVSSVPLQTPCEVVVMLGELDQMHGVQVSWAFCCLHPALLACMFG